MDLNCILRVNCDVLCDVIDEAVAYACVHLESSGGKKLKLMAAVQPSPIVRRIFGAFPLGKGLLVVLIYCQVDV